MMTLFVHSRDYTYSNGRYNYDDNDTADNYDDDTDTYNDITDNDDTDYSDGSRHCWYSVLSIYSYNSESIEVAVFPTVI